MDSQEFLAEFGHVVNASDGVARLRELVLHLAIQGRLLDPTEIVESSNVLLAEVRSIRSRLVAEKMLPREKNLFEISESEVPAHTPQHWGWARFGELWHLLSGRDLEPGQYNDSRNGIPYITGASNIENGFINVNRWTPFPVVVSVKNDLLITCKGTIGKTAFNKIGNAHIARQIMAIRNFSGKLNTGFLKIWLDGYVSQLIEKSKSMIPGFSRDDLVLAVYPIPPLKEQSCIVTKVDELMILCDKLEAQQQDRRKLQNNLRKSTLQAVARAPSPHELQTTWTRLANNFGQLFHLPEDVADLRQLAMDLAVRGLLTERHEDDEPAIHLLSRIALEHKKMVLAGETKRSKLNPDIDLSEAPFELPRGWAWARFPEVGFFGRGKSKHRPRNDPKLFTPGIYPLVQTGEVARANNVISEYHSKYSEIGLAQSKLWPKGTLCITIAANIADAAILGFDACFPDSVVGFIPASEIRDEVEYFLLFMKTARERLLAFAPSTAQKNINLEILQSVLIPVPPKGEIKRILFRVKEINDLCDLLVSSRKNAQNVGKLLALASVASITGIATEQEEEPMKAPQTELIAPLRLGQAPNIKAQAPLATILARHNGEMSAKDLWQRFSGEIDAFYAQLKTEVAHGWIAEPEVAEMREKQVNRVSV